MKRAVEVNAWRGRIDGRMD
uniref:Uncharacterized protein n=1 Tax=Physcomitrium patens TaxID=3218 RepID=A0A2K1IFX3_PHYPA|nr:hypothetical protein PHYPA_028768 [Physcomitrium patens]